MVMERLKSLDYIAYIRFASIYREFADITALKQEVDTLVGSQTETSPPTNQLPLLPSGKLEERDKGYRGARRKVRLRQNNPKNSETSLKPKIRSRK